MSKIDTTITAVTVYPDRARVTRCGSVDLETGVHSLEIPELSLRLNPDSLRATARGTAHTRLLSVQAKRTFFAETPTEKVRQLEKEIESLQDELKRFEARSKLIEQNRAALDSLIGQSETYAMALAAGEMSVEAQLALFDGLRSQAEKLDAELQSIVEERREKEKRLQKLQKELEQQRSARPRERYAATVMVEVLKAGELTVELSYVVSGAGWKPLYDMRLVENEDEQAIEVGYLAQVTQNSAEAWEGVRLSLSTARPALAGMLPELDPWFIAPFQPPIPAPAPRRAMKLAAPAPQATVAAVAAAAPEAGAVLVDDAEVVTAEVEATGAAVTYRVTEPVSVPSDGQPHKVSVAYFSLPPELDYVVTPKLVEVAYRRAKVVNDSPYTLLAGDANLFVGDEFIGTTKLELTASQAEIELYMGADDRIKVERELKRRDVDKRLIGGKRRLTYGYEIELENLLPVPARITLNDQIPAARHEDIKVKLESAEPQPKEHSELNLLEWEFTLEPKAKQVVRFDFSVAYPQEMQIRGLP